MARPGTTTNADDLVDRSRRRGRCTPPSKPPNNNRGGGDRDDNHSQDEQHVGEVDLHQLAGAEVRRGQGDRVRRRGRRRGERVHRPSVCRRPTQHPPSQPVGPSARMVGASRRSASFTGTERHPRGNATPFPVAGPALRWSQPTGGVGRIGRSAPARHLWGTFSPFERFVKTLLT